MCFIFHLILLLHRCDLIFFLFGFILVTFIAIVVTSILFRMWSGNKRWLFHFANRTTEKIHSLNACVCVCVCNSMRQKCVHLLYYLLLGSLTGHFEGYKNNFIRRFNAEIVCNCHTSDKRRESKKKIYTHFRRQFYIENAPNTNQGQMLKLKCDSLFATRLKCECIIVDCCLILNVLENISCCWSGCYRFLRFKWTWVFFVCWCCCYYC